MKALCLEKPHVITLQDLPEPVLATGNAIIDIQLCGVCGTDIGGFKGISPVIQYPVMGMGHEAVGTVAAIGPNDKGLKVGDKVCLEPYTNCGACYACGLGRYNSCENLRTCGVHRPGMMAEKISHPIRLVHKIPDDMTWEQGCMVEPLTIGLHANHRAGVKEGEYCLVIGAGSIGMLTALVAREYGATPILADPVEERLAFSKTLGIANVCNNARDDLVEYLLSVCGGALPHVVIDCSGAGPAVEKCADYVRNCGRMVFVGWPKQPSNIDISWYIRKELDVFASRNSHDEFPESIELVSGGKIPVADVISTIVPMEDAPAMFEDLVVNPGNHLKAVVRVRKE